MNVPPNYSQYPRQNQGGGANGGGRGPGVYFELIGDGFRMLFRTPKVYITAGAIAVGMFLLAYIGMIVIMVTMTPKQSSGGIQDFPILPILSFYGMIFAAIFLMRMLMVGVSVCAIEDADTGQTSLATLFSSFRRFGAVFATVFICQLTIGIGTIFCYVPGFYLMGVLAFAPELVIIEELGPFEAMSRSYEMIKPYAWMMALLAFVLTILGSAGSMACLIGLAVTMPVQYIVIGLHYREFRGGQRHAPVGFVAPYSPTE